MRKKASQVIHTPDNHLAISICNMLSVILKTNDCLKFLQKEGDISKKALDKIFIFAFSWGMGASLDEKS